MGFKTTRILIQSGIFTGDLNGADGFIDIIRLKKE